MNTYIVKIDFNYIDDNNTIKDSVSREYLVETENNANYALTVATEHMQANETNLMNVNLMRDIVNVESHLVRWVTIRGQKSAQIKRIA